MTPHIPDIYTARVLDTLWRSLSFKGRTLRMALCDCKEANEDWDIALTEAEGLHCKYCGEFIKTVPLLRITRGTKKVPGSTKWIDNNSGKELTVFTQDGTEIEEQPSQPARSQVPRW